MNSPSAKLSSSPRYKWWVFLAVAVGTFTSVADFGILIVALPTIADHFVTDLPTTQWVLIGYSLTISALLLPMGRLSDIIGRKQVYIAGFVIFVIGGVFAGTSPNIVVLILFKILQGVGASMTQGTGMAMAISAFPNNERGKALGSQITVVGSGNIIGPAIGGFIVGALGWRWIFYVTVMLSVVSIIATLMVIDSKRFSRRGEGDSAFDWIGAALSTAIMVTFLLTMTNGPRIGWTSPYILGALVALVSFIGTFIWWELRVATPMMDMRYFKKWVFSLGVGTGFIAFMGNSSVRFLMPFYLQAVLGYSPAQVGLIVIPSAIAMLVMGPISGRLSDKYGWKKFVVGGLLVSASGLLLLSRLDTDSPLFMVIIGMVLQIGGNGIFNPPNNSSILRTVEESKYGVMSGFVNLIRNSGNITGIAVATAIVTAVMASLGFPPTLAAVSESGGAGVLNAFASGLRLAYIIIGSIVILAALASLTRRTDSGDEQPVTSLVEKVPSKGTA